MARRMVRSTAPQHFHTNSTTPPTRRNKKRKSRGQDAFALASTQNPDHVKIKQHRLGESELDAFEPRHKRQRMLDEETDNEDAPPPSDAQRLKQKKVNKGERGPGGFGEESMDSGSDSEGNHWRIGPGEESEGDESVNSDEAFGESDEDRFEDFAFRGSKSAQRSVGEKIKKPRDVEDEGGGVSLDERLEKNSVDDEASDGSLGSDAIDLATALDQNEEDEAEQDAGKSARKAKGNHVHIRKANKDSPVHQLASRDESSEANTESSDDDPPTDIGAQADEVDSTSDDMDWLKNFDSEISPAQKPKHDSSQHSKSGATDWTGFSDESEVDSLVHYSTNMDNVDESDTSIDDADAPSSKSKSLQEIASAFAKADGYPSSDDDDDEDSYKPGTLMRLLENEERKEKGLAPLPKNAKRKGDELLVKPPLPPRQQNKLDRKVAYQKAKETLNRWQDTVKHNRHAEHLHFPLADPDAQIPAGTDKILPTDTSQPRNKLENAIEEILQQSGLAKKQKKEKAEDNGDEDNETPDQRQHKVKEEIERRRELQKARDMIFREEQRAKRIKRIKSKTYRRVHRKEKQRDAQRERDILVAEGLVDSDEEKEKSDKRRAEERMGGRHRDSRWAKSVKATGRAGWDEDARDGIADMAKRNEELRARMTGRTNGNMSNSSDDNDSTDDKEQEFRLRDKLEDLETHEDVEPHGVAAMPFMRRAEEAQRKQNDETIRQLRKTMDGEESDASMDENTGRLKFGPTSSARQANQNIKHNEFEEPESSDKEYGLLKDPEDLDDMQPPQALNVRSEKLALHPSKELPKLQPPASLLARPSATVSASSSETLRASPVFHSALQSPQPTKPPQKTDVKSQKTHSAPKTPSEALESLLMRSDIPHAPPHTEDRKRSPHEPSDGKKTAEVENASENASETEEQEEANDAAHSLNLTNEQLVQAAFGIDEAADAAFAAEKRVAEESEDEQYQSNALPGWGSWTGAGLSKHDRAHAHEQKTQSIKKSRGGVQKDRRKDKGMDHVIISEKKVKKNDKYLASELPHPFESRAQYERSLRIPLGKEWNTKQTFQRGTKPRVMVKQGVIAPMRKPLL